MNLYSKNESFEPKAIRLAKEAFDVEVTRRLNNFAEKHWSKEDLFKHLFPTENSVRIFCVPCNDYDVDNAEGGDSRFGMKVVVRFRMASKTYADEGELSTYIADESVLVVDEMPVKISIGIELFQGKYVSLKARSLYDFVENAKANIEQIIGKYIAGCN